MTFGSDCVDPNHFFVDPDTGAISPQPWTQWRRVKSVTALSKSGNYAVTGGGNKNDLLHLLSAAWTNNTPLTQLVYGLVTRGGATMVLQARSRAYLLMKHAVSVVTPPASPGFVLVPVSQIGLGYDMGLGGTLGIGTGYCVGEMREPAKTLPLQPTLTGWSPVPPGQQFNGQVSLSYVSDAWESASIDGGASGTESSYITGDTRIDIFAVPVLS
jgi:hypothetical protein